MRAWSHSKKKTPIPLIVILWATSYYHFLSLCRHYGCLLRITGVGVRRQKPYLSSVVNNTHLMMSAWNHWWFQRHGPEQLLLKDFCKTQKKQSPNVNARAWEMVRNAGQRISLHFPFFMYLWHVIKPGCLDREITPCLPTNKPPALVSSPLFIIHNLLWCQGQSDCIVMVKGKSGDQELSTRIENPGTRQTKTWSLTAWIVINNLKRYDEAGKS